MKSSPKHSQFKEITDVELCINKLAFQSAFVESHE